MKTIFSLFCFIFLILFVGCSRLQVEIAQEESEVYLSSIPEYTRSYVHEGKAHFYLWGLYPPDGNFILVDEILLERGIRSSAKVEVRTFRTWSDMTYGLITFGMYFPLRYEISAYYLDD